MPHGLLTLVLAAALHQPRRRSRCCPPCRRGSCPGTPRWWSRPSHSIRRWWAGSRSSRSSRAGSRPARRIQVEGLAPYFPAEGDCPPGRVLEMCLFLTAAPGPAARAAPTAWCRPAWPVSTVSAASIGPCPIEPSRASSASGREARPRSWAALLAGVQDNLPEVQRLHGARNLPVTRGRNQALLDWIERHLRAGPRRLPGSDTARTTRLSPAELQDQREVGWGELERLPFLWVLDSGVLADCSRAPGELYAEISGGDCLGLDRPTFCSRAGRDFLLQAALDEGRLEGSASQSCLALSRRRPTLRGPAPLDGAEQGTLLERLPACSAPPHKRQA